MVPLFFQAAAMSAVILILCVVLGTPIVTGIAGALFILVLAGLFGLAISGASFIPALITKSEQATSTLSLLLFRSEEHTSELQSLMRISYAVFCLKKQQT